MVDLSGFAHHHNQMNRSIVVVRLIAIALYMHYLLTFEALVQSQLNQMIFLYQSPQTAILNFSK